MADPGSFRPADSLFPNRRVAIHADICAICSNAASEFKDDLSRREYRISGLCQACQDSVFGSDDGEDLIDD